MGYPLINGKKYDWSTVEIELGDAGIFTGVSELSYSDSNDKGIVRGTGVEKLARTQGQYDAEASMVMPTKDFQDFIAALTGGGVTGYFDTTFNITVAFDAPGGDGTTTVRLIGCELKKAAGGGSEGTDPTKESVDLDVMYIERDGILPFADMLT